MGNHFSCISSATLQRLQATSDSNTLHLIKFLHVETGTVSELEGPLTAAEVMMEFPAQFLACISNTLSSGRRITAVLADEELQAAELYLLLPMHRLNMRFSVEEMAFLATVEAGKDSGKKHRRGAMPQSKVAPLPAAMCSTQRSNAEGVVGQSMKSTSLKRVEVAEFQGAAASLHSMGAAKNVICRAKSWIPRLETITESAVA